MKAKQARAFYGSSAPVLFIQPATPFFEQERFAGRRGYRSAFLKYTAPGTGLW